MDTLTLGIFFLSAMVLLIGFAGQVIFRKTDVPDIIWLLLFGIMLSVVLPAEQKALLAQFAAPFGALALLVILFNSGTEFDLIKFSQGIFRGTVLCGFAFFVTTLLTTFITMNFLGWPVLYGLLLGVVVGGTSSGVVVPIITRLKVREYMKYLLTIESTGSDILVIVFAIVIINILGSGEANLLFALKDITAAFSIGITTGLFGAVLWLFTLLKIEQEVQSYLLHLTIVLVLYAFTEFIGGSGAIAALIFGLVMGNISTIRRVVMIPEGVGMTRGERAFYSELNFFVRSFFFVYLGVLFDFSNLVYTGIGLALVLIFMIGRFGSVYLAMIKSSLSRTEKNLASFMVSKGLSATVMSQMPLVMLAGAITNERELEILGGFSQIVLAVVFFSIVVNVLGVYYLRRQLTQSTEPEAEKPPVKANVSKRVK